MQTEPNLSTSSGRQRQSANRVAIGQTLAVLFCPGPHSCTVGVIIDSEDVDRVIGAGLWRVGEFPAGLYCYKVGAPGKPRGRGNVYLHRFVHRAAHGEYVDHIHHHTLDNRKSETRKCTQGLNQLNRRYGGHGFSGHRGVTWKRGKWETKIQLDKKSHYLGRFDDKELAAETVRKFLSNHGVSYAEEASYA